MSDRIKIEIGVTDGFRYVGLQPPLNEDQKAAVNAASPEDDVSFNLRQPTGSGMPYHEIGYMTDWDDTAIYKASQAAVFLRFSGVEVSTDYRVRQIGWGHYLFGGADDPCV